jgi:hypothetical protein
VDLGIGVGSRRGRDAYKSVGRWVKPGCGNATGEERKGVKDILTGSV